MIAPEPDSRLMKPHYHGEKMSCGMNDRDSQHSGNSGSEGSSWALAATVELSAITLSCVWTLVRPLGDVSLVSSEEFDKASLRWSLLFLPLHNVSCQDYCSMSADASLQISRPLTQDEYSVPFQGYPQDTLATI